MGAERAARVDPLEAAYTERKKSIGLEGSAVRGWTHAPLLQLILQLCNEIFERFPFLAPCGPLFGVLCGPQLRVSAWAAQTGRVLWAGKRGTHTHSAPSAGPTAPSSAASARPSASLAGLRECDLLLLRPRWQLALLLLLLPCQWWVLPCLSRTVLKSVAWPLTSTSAHPLDLPECWGCRQRESRRRRRRHSTRWWQKQPSPRGRALPLLLRLFIDVPPSIDEGSPR